MKTPMMRLSKIEDMLHDRNILKISELTGIKYKLLLSIQKGDCLASDISAQDMYLLSNYFRLNP